MALTLAAPMSEGVPPPKNTEVTIAGPGIISAAAKSSSLLIAPSQATSGICARTCELKSQYGHFAAQKGQ
jgi:hypothetical protein